MGEDKPMQERGDSLAKEKKGMEAAQLVGSGLRSGYGRACTLACMSLAFGQNGLLFASRIESTPMTGTRDTGA